jgi:hypothetical protein
MLSTLTHAGTNAIAGDGMWEQYKKTFWGMQIAIAAISLTIFKMVHVWGPPVVFFATMQVGSVVGALWATRLKRKFTAPPR